MALLLLAMLPGCRAPRGEGCTSCSVPPSPCCATENRWRPSEEQSTEPQAALTPAPEEDEGPADGLTLDAAIERLLAANYDLAAKYQDIPKARADILSAGLRNDPVLFLSATQLPY